MLTEPQASRVADTERVANLSDVTLRRSPYAVADKDGDITAALAAMPSSPEILDADSFAAPMPGAGNLRDVTPHAAAASRDILEYWNNLRGRDAMPSRDRLRASEVAGRWPNLVLFRCSRGAAGIHPDSAFSTAIRANRGSAAAGLPREPEATALLSQWMARVARAVAENGAPVQDRLHIDTANGRVEYAMNMLPFAEGGGGTSSYVLCNVEPVT